MDVDAEVKIGGVETALGREVIEYLYKVADMDCSKASVLGGGPCGTCPPCLAKPLVKRVQDTYTRLGWSREPCRTCKGVGTRPVKKR